MSDPLRSVIRRVQNVVRAVRSTVAPNDGGTVQTVQLMHSNAQTVDSVRTVQHYGFASVPPVGTDYVVVHVAGDTSNGVAIGSNHQKSRPTGGSPGRVTIYDSSGSVVVLEPSAGSISLKPSGGTVSIIGALDVSGDATIGGKSFLGHMHGDVQKGSDNTGAPI